MRILDGTTYRDMTSEEIAAATYTPTAHEKITALKQKLAATDYQAIKYAEGLLSEQEYAETKAQRQSWRDEINRLESLL